MIALGIGLGLKPGENFNDAFRARGAEYLRQVRETVGRLRGVEMVATVSGGTPLTRSWSRRGLRCPGAAGSTPKGMTWIAAWSPRTICSCCAFRC